MAVIKKETLLQLKTPLSDRVYDQEYCSICAGWAEYGYEHAIETLWPFLKEAFELCEAGGHHRLESLEERYIKLGEKLSIKVQI